MHLLFYGRRIIEPLRIDILLLCITKITHLFSIKKVEYDLLQYFYSSLKWRYEPVVWMLK